MFLVVTQGGHPRWSGTLRLRSATYLGDHLTTDHLFSSPTLAKLRYPFTRGRPSARKYLNAQAGRVLAACSRLCWAVLRFLGRTMRSKVSGLALGQTEPCPEPPGTRQGGKMHWNPSRGKVLAVGSK